MARKSPFWYSPHVEALCKKNQKGNMQKYCVEPPQKWTFSFPKIMKISNNSRIGEI